MSLAELEWGLEPLVEPSLKDMDVEGPSDVPRGVLSPDNSPKKRRPAHSPSIESKPIMLDTPPRSASLDGPDEDTPRTLRTHKPPPLNLHSAPEISRWSASTLTSTASSSLDTPRDLDGSMTFPRLRRERSSTFGEASAYRLPSPPLPPKPAVEERPNTARKRASTVAVPFEPRSTHSKRESFVGVSPPKTRARPSTAVDPIRLKQEALFSKAYTLTRPSTAPALRATRSAFDISPSSPVPPNTPYRMLSRPNTANRPQTASRPSTANRAVSRQLTHEAPSPIVDRVLSLIIDQEGFREIEVHFRFRRFDKTTGMWEFRPLDYMPSPFSHNTLQAPPILRRLLTDNGGRTNFLTRQASLSVKKEGMHHVEEQDGRRKWRFVYRVEERKSLVGRKLAGEKVLIPLAFGCSAELLNPDASIKILRAVKSAALPRLSSAYIVPPASAPAPPPTGFKWVADDPRSPPLPPLIGDGHHRYSPLAHTVRPRTSSTRPGTAKSRPATAASSRPSTAASHASSLHRPTTADSSAKLLFRLS